MEHAMDFLGIILEIAQHQPGFVGPAVDGGSRPRPPSRYGLVSPIGETAGFQRANGAEDRKQFKRLGAGWPRCNASEEGVQGKETMEAPGCLGIELAVADDPARARTDQLPFQRQLLKIGALAGPFAVTPFVGDDIIGKILGGEHRGGGVMDDHQPARTDTAARPFHEV